MLTVQIPRIGFIFVHHGGVMISGEQLMWLYFSINIMGILKRLIFLCGSTCYFCTIKDMSR